MLRIIWKIRMLLLSENELFYINGSETLPPPLSRAEETEVMKRISEGECKAREILIVHNLRLVVYIAKKFESPPRLRMRNLCDLVPRSRRSFRRF